jgi:hypothetical protein
VLRGRDRRLAAVALMVALFAVVAYAADIQGTDNSETLIESQRNDQIAGHRGEDDILAGFYDIGQTPGGLGDTDKVKGNRGDDFIDLVDGDNRDTGNGGRGVDECVGDPQDELKNCEL